MLSTYGAPREVITDQGSEFRGELGHSQECTHMSDRLAERMVQTTKKAFRKCLLKGGGEQWDELLAYVAMGYMLSKQKLLGYSPYFMHFGREPIF